MGYRKRAFIVGRIYYGIKFWMKLKPAIQSYRNTERFLTSDKQELYQNWSI